MNTLIHNIGRPHTSADGEVPLSLSINTIVQDTEIFKTNSGKNMVHSYVHGHGTLLGNCSEVFRHPREIKVYT